MHGCVIQKLTTNSYANDMTKSSNLKTQPMRRTHTHTHEWWNIWQLIWHGHCCCSWWHSEKTNENTNNNKKSKLKKNKSNFFIQIKFLKAHTQHIYIYKYIETREKKRKILDFRSDVLCSAHAYHTFSNDNHIIVIIIL